MSATTRLARSLVLLSALVGVAALASPKQEEPAAPTGPDAGVLVVTVEPGSPAASAGIVRGDIIISVDGKIVDTGTDLRAAVAARQPGDTVKVVVRHGDRVLTRSVTIGERSGQAFLGVYFAAGPAVTPDAPAGAPTVPAPRPAPRAGDGNRGQVLAVSGAYVAGVTEGGPAEKAGLRVGDVIVAIDDEAFDRGDDLATAIGAFAPGDTVRLRVSGTPDGGREVAVTLGANPRDAAKAWLGVEYRMQLRVEGATPWTNRLGVILGVRVTEVVDGSPAAAAGIARGDLIVTVDGRDVLTAAQASAAIAARAPGDTIEIGVAVSGTDEVRRLAVTLAENPDRAGAAYLGVQLGGPGLGPGLELKRMPGGRPFGGPGRTPPGRGVPGGIDA